MGIRGFIRAQSYPRSDFCNRDNIIIICLFINLTRHVSYWHNIRHDDRFIE